MCCVCVCVCSHHQSSVCGEQCVLSCDWQSTLADRVDTSGHTPARHSAAAELEADGADIHSRSPPAHSLTQTYSNKHNKEVARTEITHTAHTGKAGNTDSVQINIEVLLFFVE